MPRLFIGIPLPDPVTRELALMGGGIPGARWEPPEKLHLTLRFLGDVDGGTARRVERALARVDRPPFSMSLRGVGVFPPRGKPRILWAGVAEPDPVIDLKRRVDRVLDPLGVPAERRNFHPHVTLARLKHPPERRVATFVTEHALYASAPFAVDAFVLYSSVLNPAGSRYKVEARFELTA